MSEGLKIRQQMLEAGAPANQVDEWVAGQRQKMLDAGAPLQDADAYWGIKEPEDLPGIPNVTAHIQASFDILKPENRPRYATNMAEAFSAGWQTTATGLQVRGQSPNLELAPDADWTQKGAAAVASIADLPMMVAGGVGGGFVGSLTGNPLGTFAGAGGGAALLPSAWRNILMDQYEHPGGARNWDEVAKRSGKIIMETGINTAAGVAGSFIGGVAGQQAARMGGNAGAQAVSNIFASAITETAAQSAMRMQVPSADDFIIAVVMGIGMHSAGTMVNKVGGGRTVKLSPQGEQLSANLRQIYRDHGIPPKEAIRLMQEDANLKAEMLAPRAADGTRITPGLDAHKLRDPDVVEQYEPRIRAEAAPQVNVDAGLDTVTNLVSKLETGHIKNEAVRHTVVSPAGAIGYNQIMPDTAKQYGFDPARLTDKEYNIQASRVILADLSKRYNGDLEAILIGYNAGPGRANAFLRSGRDYNILPRETRGYLANAERAGILDRGIIQNEVEKQLQGLRGDYTPPVHQGQRGQGGDLSWQRAPAFKDVWVTRRVRNGDSVQVIPDPDSVASYMQEFGRLAGFKFQVSDQYWKEGPGQGEYGGPQQRAFGGDAGGPAFSRYSSAEGAGDMGAPRQVWMPRADDALMRRWYGLGNSEIIYHEAGHAIDWFFNRSKVTKYIPKGSKLEAELIEASKNFRPFLWEKNPTYNGTASELMADAFAAWLSNPEMRQRMPEFTRAYGERLKPFLEAANKALPTRKAKETVNEKGEKKVTVEEGWNDPEWEVALREREKAQEGGGGKPPKPPKGGLPEAPKEPGKKPPRIDLDPALRLSEDDLVAKLMDRIGEPGVRVGIPVEEPIGWFAKMRRVLEDQFGGELSSPAHRVEKKLGVQEHILEDAFRLIYSSRDRAQMFFDTGVIEPVSYEVVSRASWKRAMKEVGGNGGTTEGFYAYMMYGRALELAKRGVDVGIDLDDAVQYLSMKGVGKKYEKAAATIRENKNGTVDYIHIAELVDQKRADALKDLGQWHISLNRIIDPKWVPIQPGIEQGVRQRPIKIKGGSNTKFVDIPTAEFHNKHLMIAMADRNMAVLNLVRAIRDWESRQPKQIEDQSQRPYVIETLPDGSLRVLDDGVLEDGFGRPLPKEAAEAWAPFVALRNAYQGKLGLGPSDILFFEGGKPMVLRVKDPDVAKLLKVVATGQHSKELPFIILQKFAQAERTGITIEPTFTFRSWSVGQLAAAVQAENGLAYPGQNMLFALKERWRAGEFYEKWRARGGATAAISDAYNIYGEKGLDQLPATEQGTWNVFTNPRLALEAIRQLRPLERFRKFTHFMDDASRMAFTKTMLDREFAEQRAVSGARTGHLDYAEQFTQSWLNNYSQYTVFFTTMVKDLGQFGKAIADNKGKLAATGFAVFTMPTLTNWAANMLADTGKAEDDPTRYYNQQSWLRDQYWVLPAVYGHRIKIPRGIGPAPAIFSLPMERFLEALAKEDPRGAFDLAKSVVAQSLSPSLPTLAQPFLDHARNKTELGQPLITQDLEGASGHMQYGPNTTETAKALSRLVGAPTLGSYGADVSPIVIENYVRQWTGSVPLKALQYLESKITEDTRPWEPADNPLVGWFFVRNPVGGQKVNDFYEAYKEFETAQKDLRLAKRRLNLDEVREVDLAKAAFKMNGLKTAIGKQRAMIKTIYDTKTVEEGEEGQRGPGTAMTLAEKRKFIDAMSQQMVTAATMGLQQMREFRKMKAEIDKSNPAQ
ncbi:MAG: hypothetical protein E6Q97_28150 [Desulfurellales bacterium]|nr:MAG: hypothetical protein E6Q97_28150 [Desulfurellales bacterium]